MSSRTVKITATVIGALALLGSAPAFALGPLDATTTGAYSYSHGARGQVALRDTAGDGSGVYAPYQRTYNTSTQTLRNYNGSGTETRTGDNPGDPVWIIKACRDRQAWPDNCTDWVGPNLYG